MKEVYVCFRQWQGERADINGDYVGDMVVLDSEEKAVGWLTEEIDMEFEDAKENDGPIVFDKYNPCVKSSGHINYETAKMMLQKNHGVYIRVYDEYQDNYDSYSDIVIEIKAVE